MNPCSPCLISSSQAVFKDFSKFLKHINTKEKASESNTQKVSSEVCLSFDTTYLKKPTKIRVEGFQTINLELSNDGPDIFKKIIMIAHKPSSQLLITLQEPNEDFLKAIRLYYEPQWENKDNYVLSLQSFIKGMHNYLPNDHFSQEFGYIQRNDWTVYEICCRALELIADLKLSNSFDRYVETHEECSAVIKWFQQSHSSPPPYYGPIRLEEAIFINFLLVNKYLEEESNNFKSFIDEHEFELLLINEKPLYKTLVEAAGNHHNVRNNILGELSIGEKLDKHYAVWLILKPKNTGQNRMFIISIYVSDSGVEYTMAEASQAKCLYNSLKSSEREGRTESLEVDNRFEKGVNCLYTSLITITREEYLVMESFLEDLEPEKLAKQIVPDFEVVSTVETLILNDSALHEPGTLHKASSSQKAESPDTEKSMMEVCEYFEVLSIKLLEKIEVMQANYFPGRFFCPCPSCSCNHCICKSTVFKDLKKLDHQLKEECNGLLKEVLESSELTRKCSNGTYKEERKNEDEEEEPVKTFDEGLINFLEDEFLTEIRKVCEKPKNVKRDLLWKFLEKIYSEFGGNVAEWSGLDTEFEVAKTFIEPSLHYLKEEDLVGTIEKLISNIPKKCFPEGTRKILTNELQPLLKTIIKSIKKKTAERSDSESETWSEILLDGIISFESVIKRNIDPKKTHILMAMLKKLKRINKITQIIVEILSTVEKLLTELQNSDCWGEEGRREEFIPDYYKVKNKNTFTNDSCETFKVLGIAMIGIPAVGAILCWLYSTIFLASTCLLQTL